MIETFSIFGVNIYWRDILDVALISLLFYQIIQLFKGTRALAAMLGLGILMVLFFISSSLGLYTLSWLLQHIFSSLFLVVVILFQKDIRQWLGDIGARYFWRTSSMRQGMMEQLIMACTEMANKQIGALVVIERSMPLKDMITREGVKIDARFSKKLLMNIFYPNAPLHDGAVIISKSKISAAACILPLAVVQGQNFGTRHRAALGITEESDAIVIVVSEERGEISVAFKGELIRDLSANRLNEVLSNAI